MDVHLDKVIAFVGAEQGRKRDAAALFSPERIARILAIDAVARPGIAIQAFEVVDLATIDVTQHRDLEITKGAQEWLLLGVGVDHEDLCLGVDLLQEHRPFAFKGAKVEHATQFDAGGAEVS